MSLALENRNLSPTRVTSQDLKNANLLLGPCIPCIQSKMRTPSKRPCDSHPAQQIGQHVHVDIVPIATSIGGNNYILFSINERYDYIFGIPIPIKSNSHLIKTMNVIICIYVQQGHVLSHITTDNENNLRSMEHQLRTRIGSLSTTPTRFTR